MGCISSDDQLVDKLQGRAGEGRGGREGGREGRRVTYVGKVIQEKSWARC